MQQHFLTRANMLSVYRVLLTLLHVLYNLYCALHRCSLIIGRKCNEFWYGKRTEAETQMLVGSCNSDKLPRHLVVVLGQKENSILQLVQIIAWCITLGIPYVSFYDHNGFLLNNENITKETLAKLRRDLVEKISWNNSLGSQRKNGVNGIKSTIHVSSISNEDSKGRIVLVAQALARAASIGNIKSEEINDNLLDEKLKFEAVPNPDLTLICDYTFSTYGLLPWHTRTTAFFTLPLHSNLSAKDFVCILKQYSQCQQRYGK